MKQSAKSGTSDPITAAVDPSLLLKLLFTSQPLSIQVHPDDEFAHSMGLANGKTEAWYVLSATPEAKVALGLKSALTPQQLREASTMARSPILLRGTPCRQTTSFSLPAGTIHAIGAGLVIAEMQQRSDMTFRLFDYGRKRELHVENAIAVADGRAGRISGADRASLTAERQTFCFQPTLCDRTDRSGAKFPLVHGSGTRDLASRSRWRVPSPERSTLPRRCFVCTIGSCRHSLRRHRHGGSCGVHGRRPGSAPAATSRTARRDQCRTAARNQECLLLIVSQRPS